VGSLFFGFLGFAGVIKTLDRTPCPVSTGLPCLRIEGVGERIVPGKDGTIALQIMLAGVFIDPLAQTLVANELYHANGFINGGILLCIASHFVFVDQHPSTLSFPHLSGRVYSFMS